MMHWSPSTFWIWLAFALLVAGVPEFARLARAKAPLLLAQDGMTKYTIVIAKEAPEPVVNAAGEMSFFLEEMTRAKFEIRRENSPQMFALIDGKRTPRELCLSHPQTLRVATKTALAWAQQGSDDPGTRSITHISQNDTGSPGCQCPDCATADKEEGVQFTGQLIRFVNNMARQIGRDHPDVYVETLAYHRSEYPPGKTVAEPNVSVWFAPIGLDLGRPLDEQPKHWNNLQGWRRVTRTIYIWDYPQGFHDLLAPFPSLWTQARNIQLFAENGVKGYMPPTCSPLMKSVTVAVPLSGPSPFGLPTL